MISESSSSILDIKGTQMATRTITGDEAMALGAMASGVSLVASYPGSPSSGTVDVLISQAEKRKMYVEWSSNEKVAMETGIGASMAGRRALVCTKSVGLNAMVDPLMALNLTPVHGGLVILVGDDPGAYGSQNDQDSRPLASLLEMPMIEPASASEGYAMMQEAFAISERVGTAVIIRETRAFTQHAEEVTVSDEVCSVADLGLIREPWRFVPVPLNAVEKHRELHKRIEILGEWADQVSFNRMMGSGTRGIISAGFAHGKLLDVLGDRVPDGWSLLKLGVLFPLPRKTIGGFIQDCHEVLIVEEIEPYLETQIKAIAYDAGCGAKICGKQSRHLSREKELFRWQIQRALSEWVPGFVPAREFRWENENEERPKKESHCADCRYDEILDSLEEAARSLGQKPVLIGDPGCLVTVADRLDAKYALGSAIAVADGLSKSGVSERAVAIFGDSSFFHTSLPAICNAVHNRSDILMVVLDNQATATSGFQPHPGVGKNAMGEDAPAQDIERLARACGVPRVVVSGRDDARPTLAGKFRDALGRRDLALMIVRC
jgi:indolepyruvate ferredoxin oxidoreductase alpha subunit